MADQKNKPEVSFRVGVCVASVFVNEVDGDAENREFRTVTVQRAYKDGSEWKYTNSYSIGDIPQLLRALELAQQHIEDKEVKFTNS